jgi:hypothetical protein
MQHKNLRRTLTAAMLTLLATTAYSQHNVLTAKIPFGFRAVGSDLPAGPYEVRQTSGSSRALELRNLDTGKTVFIPSKDPALSEAGDARPRLIFQCGGEGNCSLARLWSGTGAGVEFSTPALTSAQRERMETIYLDRFKGK